MSSNDKEDIFLAARSAVMHSVVSHAQLEALSAAMGTTSLTENDSTRNGHHHKDHLGATGATGTGTGTGGFSSTGSHDTTGKKPGLMDKLNPKKDADGDGKAGIMD
jgi:hypothetical protein